MSEIVISGALISGLSLMCIGFTLGLSVAMFIYLSHLNNKYDFNKMFPNSPSAIEERKRKQERKDKIFRMLRLRGNTK